MPSSVPIYAGTLIARMITLVGPVTLAYGRDDQSRDELSLTIGRTF